ncbi:RANGAP1 family protein [Megaselia abdita]
MMSGSGVSFAGKAQKWEDEEKVRELVNAINKCKNLEFLDLEGNTLGVEAAVYIGKALEKHPELKKALWKDLFTGRLKTEIPAALKKMGGGMMTAGAQLTVLDCSDNALGPNGMVGLEDLIRSPVCYSLQELMLNNCGLGIGGGIMLAKALLDCHASSSKAGKPLALKVFIAGRNRLENDGGTALAKFFETVKTLEHVAMPQNGIYFPGITAISKGLAQNPNMKILNLNDNTIRYKGALALADAFESMPNLLEINFGDCLLKNDGTMVIAEAICDSHEKLEVVNLSANEMKSDLGLEVVKAVQNKANLKLLNLNSNEFGYDGKELIRSVMESGLNPDALDSLSDDESPDEDDEDEEDDGEECEEEEEDDDDATGEYNSNPEDEDNIIVEESDPNTIDLSSLQMNNNGPATIDTFFNTPHPSLELFNNLSDTNKLDAFRKHLDCYEGEDYLIGLVFTTMKFAALSKESNEALDLAKAFFDDCFKYAAEKSQTNRVKNFFLIQMGLLKSEDKKFVPHFNVESSRFAIEESLKIDSIPQEIKETFKTFLIVK